MHIRMNKKYIRFVFILVLSIFGTALMYNLDIKSLVGIAIKNENSQVTLTINKLPKIVYRQDLGVLMEALSAETMIEIGTHKGWFAKDILSKWPSFRRYYGVDPWRQQRFYRDGTNVKDENQEKAFEEAINILQEFGERITLYRDFSKNAAKRFDDESIDLIYLDGRHDYCGITNDLKLYYPKLKCGGIMAGNAYLTVAEQFNLSNDDFSLCEDGDVVLQNGGGVKGNNSFRTSCMDQAMASGAVIDFAQAKNIVDIRKTNETWPSFYFLKTC